MHTLLPGHYIYFVELPLLIVLISLVYSATRFEEWGAILYEAARWGLRLALFLFAIGVVLTPGPVVNSYANDLKDESITTPAYRIHTIQSTY